MAFRRMRIARARGEPDTRRMRELSTFRLYLLRATYLLIAVGLGAIGGAVVAWGVGGGRHLSSFDQRGGFALLVALVAAAVVYVGAPRLAQLGRDPCRPSLWLFLHRLRFMA